MDRTPRPQKMCPRAARLGQHWKKGRLAQARSQTADQDQSCWYRQHWSGWPARPDGRGCCDPDKGLHPEGSLHTHGRVECYLPKPIPTPTTQMSQHTHHPGGFPTPVIPSSNPDTAALRLLSDSTVQRGPGTPEPGRPLGVL